MSSVLSYFYKHIYVVVIMQRRLVNMQIEKSNVNEMQRSKTKSMAQDWIIRKGVWDKEHLSDPTLSSSIQYFLTSRPRGQIR